MEQTTDSSKTEEIDLEKYMHSGSIANATLKKVIEKCVEGAKIYELCELGEKFMKEELDKVYTKKEKGNKVEKGISFPITINVNEVCNNYSPGSDNEETIKSGDIVKICMGCHIDGHISIVGHTIYVGNENEKIESPKAEVLKNSHILSQLFLKSLKVGINASEITKNIQKACEDLKCNVISNCVTYQIKKYIIEGSKYILLKENPENKIEDFQIEPNDVYIIDVMVTSGDGKIKEGDHKTTIYKREVQKNYTLKTSLGRSFISEINKKFPVLPFHIKHVEDQRAALIGIPEALRHDLIKPYSVYTEKKKEYVSQFKYTVMVKEDGVKQLTGIKCSQLNNCNTVNEIQDESLKNILNSSITAKKKKAKGKINAETAQDN
ncbi:proliferation-associated protein 2g4 [Plasmodium brasilianum]|uniref:Proliferation-associated protein 2g4, putative n=2 Tax=Plasmodium (Plasmodium) TaxID=418103 RepID=A0A1A8W9L6_PLAMA|nr:proliferation-associated protein 2g4, putative [Plasmodium malariae]KAI4835739.1 proliferation-associated protein 2g4 [Plasmodium brasilianum]SBS89522.1 proliferation-associated protein, putative [Plasmodium malariae]SBT72210.1 proliferation-associated protein 2g4, putative [Plasmodium malariae]SCP02671.1 proliferation-associated protein 2g4, putative [Plasmodium malariae]